MDRDRLQNLVIAGIIVALVAGAWSAGSWIGYGAGYQVGWTAGNKEGFAVGSALRPGYDKDGVGRIIEENP